jgi:hypothetical protein
MESLTDPTSWRASTRQDKTIAEDSEDDRGPNVVFDVSNDPRSIRVNRGVAT